VAPLEEERPRGKRRAGAKQQQRVRFWRCQRAAYGPLSGCTRAHCRCAMRVCARAMPYAPAASFFLNAVLQISRIQTCQY
jgi:hypothetical protein